VQVALAGALGPAEIDRLLPLAPDWFAVRGAACRGRSRNDDIALGKVRRLSELLSGAG
jgi:uncharacterized protein (UPF0264 family)